MTSLSSLTVDELAEGICLRAGRIAAAQAELLCWVAEFDRREGWAGPGLLSCAHWLSWRIGLSPGAAREQVRVARRLEELPEVSAAFADGRVSYSKVRAITRAAEPDAGVDWVALARHSSAAQLERMVRGIRRARSHEAVELDPEVAAWTLRTRTRYDEHGNFSLTISGPAEFLPVLQAGIDAKKAELQRERDAASAALPAPPAPPAPQRDVPVAADVPAGTSHRPADEARDAASTDDDADLDEQAPGWPAGTSRRQVRQAVEGFFALPDRSPEPSESTDDDEDADESASARADEQGVPAGTPPGDPAPTPVKVTDADALLALAQDALADEQAAQPDIARRRRPQLTPQIDPLSGWARQVDGELLPPSSLRAVMKTLPGRGGLVRLRPVSDADLRRHDLGRDQREVSTALRELIGALDGERCRFPGCTRRRKLHAHHVVFWRDGGPTDLANLLLVCSRHHTLIHSLGFRLELHPDRRLDVRTADGVPVLHHPAQPWGDPAALAQGCGQRVSAEALPPDHCDARLDLRYAVSVLMQQAS